MTSSPQVTEHLATLASAPVNASRPSVRGKFLFVNGEKLYIRGVTYGTFRPNEEGQEFHDRKKVEADFAQMASAGINALRIYTVPPRWLLDSAQHHGLYVMVGLPWEQHVTFLDDRSRAADIEDRIAQGVRSCAGHPAVLCFAIGNEIPASIVRWHGRQKVEGFLRTLYEAVKREDPEALVTYVNFPTTEYLELEFVDIFCFNVYLEQRDRLEAYLARLQNLAGDRPLVMAEVGLDSRGNGEDAQAETLDWQIRACFSGGCAGMFVYSWTDEWHRGGNDIEDWDFGLTTRDRQPKPALAAVRKAYVETPFAPDIEWPAVSVVVCSYNGSRTIRETLEHLQRVDYPDFEVIVVDDGSTDLTPQIARDFNVRLISVPNGGLSNARNLGMKAATGEIVAYIDDDAYPDPHWLKYLAHAFLTSDYAAVGGPNIPPPGDGPIAEAVANSPGGPIHVLLSDREAEHIPGCNMAYRRECLDAIGGFDPQFRAAGDDVDVCWRVLERGWKIGYHPAATVWHHRRNSARAYWRQQIGYGRAEALLERKWPAKYNALGHVSWYGRIYTLGQQVGRGWAPARIYFGTWGLAPFQSLYAAPPGKLTALTQTPEWHLINAVLLLLSALGVLWQPLLLFSPLFLISILMPLSDVSLRISRIVFPSRPRSRLALGKLRLLTIVLHVIQPVARLFGRIRSGLTPWRSREPVGRSWPWEGVQSLWSETWQPPDHWLRSLREMLAASGSVVRTGGDFDWWDLSAQSGLAGAARVQMTVEEHGGGKQMVRFRSRPRPSWVALCVTAVSLGLAAGAAFDQHQVVAGILALLGLVAGTRIFHECDVACGLVRTAVKQMATPGEVTLVSNGTKSEGTD